jgi:hypothetical protein
MVFGVGMSGMVGVEGGCVLTLPTGDEKRNLEPLNLLTRERLRNIATQSLLTNS